MNIIRHFSPYIASQMYIVTEGDRAVVIDPFWKEGLIPMDLKIDFVLLTHEHSDHISGVENFRQHFGCEVYCSESCFSRIQNPRHNLSAYYDTIIQIPEFTMGVLSAGKMPAMSCRADRAFIDGSDLHWCGHVIYCKETPGHSKGSACYLIDNSILFAGDTLFKDLMTVTGFPTGSAKDFTDITLTWLKSLDPAIMVFPGHFDRFALGDRLKDFNTEELK
jgi:glyoxylase-like metal-dependent hydrolase (beta-lactamase superfamily II)